MSQVTQPRTGGRNMAVSVDAPRRTGTTDGVPFRQVWKPRVVCVVDPLNLAGALESILPRIAENQRGCTVASYLLINPETSQAFVLAEDKPVAVEMARKGDRSPYWPWLVGKYSFSRVTAEAAANVLEDILEHLGIAAEPAPKRRMPTQLDLFGLQDSAA
ncbi:hypothetical protein [Stenotrophomonas rhizophila]|uniref:hypothetical protein n=1 Tax=Stenotrophomonas rhizophila TaxID=216778 RepID=UPI00215A3996|nr:hypothetical protein [Stenotrophomonas rhizophila]